MGLWARARRIESESRPNCNILCLGSLAISVCLQENFPPPFKAWMDGRRAMDRKCLASVLAGFLVFAVGCKRAEAPPAQVASQSRATLALLAPASYSGQSGGG